MRTLLHLGLILVAFALGLAGGAWFSIQRRAGEFAAGIDRLLAEPRTASAANAADTSPPRHFASDDEMLAEVMTAVLEPDQLLRGHLLHEALGGLNSAQLALLFERALKVQGRERQGTILEAVLARWAAVDPAGAAAAVQPFRDRYRKLCGYDWMSLDAAVFSAWARAFPEAALAEAMTAPTSGWARTEAWSALGALAQGDPARRLDALFSQPANRLRDELIGTAMTELARRDPLAAEARLDLVTDPKMQVRLRAEVLGELASRDPAAALARLSALASMLPPGADAERLITKVLRAAAHENPAGALAAVEGLPEELRYRALSTALVGWAEKNPVEALEWAAAHGVDISQTLAIEHFNVNDVAAGWNNMMSMAVNADRKKVLAWLQTQPVSAERDGLIGDALWNGDPKELKELFAQMTPPGQTGMTGLFVQRLANQSSEEAGRWVRDLPAGPMRLAAIENLAIHQASRAPEQRDTFADGWSAGPDRDGALGGLAKILASADPLRALEYARRIGNGPYRERVLEKLTQAWLFRDETAARAWVTGTAELNSEQKRVLLREADAR